MRGCRRSARLTASPGSLLIVAESGVPTALVEEFDSTAFQEFGIPATTDLRLVPGYSELCEPFPRQSAGGSLPPGAFWPALTVARSEIRTVNERTGDREISRSALPTIRSYEDSAAGDSPDAGRAPGRSTWPPDGRIRTRPASPWLPRRTGESTSMRGVSRERRAWKIDWCSVLDVHGRRPSPKQKEHHEARFTRRTLAGDAQTVPRAAAKKGDIDLLLGDSITQGWNAARQEGRGTHQVWSGTMIESRGQFGSAEHRTQHVLQRIENGEIDGRRPLSPCS